MNTVVTAMLINLVEFSNVFSVLTVFLVFCAMVIFILRLHGEAFNMTSSVHYAARIPIQPTPVTKCVNPFAFALTGELNKIDDVVCVVSSQVPCELHPFWGVDIGELHRQLTSPWTEVKQLLIARHFLTGSYIHKGEPQRFVESAGTLVHLRPSVPVDPADFGPLPRRRYPLLILMLNLSEDDGVDNKVGGMAIVVHIKDTTCTVPSCIIAQYLKMTNNQLTNLKPLYVSNDTPRENHQDENQEETVDEQFVETECVVCQSRPATRALLPCRHLCTCMQCFSRLDKCPICRTAIHSYFCTREEEEQHANDAADENNELQVPRNWPDRLRRWNDWLNRAMGFCD